MTERDPAPDSDTGLGRSPEVGRQPEVLEVLGRNLEVTLRDGHTLRAWRKGRGEPLLLVHGFTGSVEAWGPGLLERLAAHFDVVAVDLLGHGESSAPVGGERYTVDEIRSDLGELLDGAGLDTATWVGYSMGGRIALSAAVELPERVGGLVLESASPGLDSAEERSARREADERLAAGLERDGLAPFVDRWMAHPLFDSQKSLPDEVHAAARRRRLRGNPTAWAACLRGLGTGRQPSYWDRLSDIDRPVTIVTGGLDTKFGLIAERMERSIPASIHRSVPRAGHQVHLEAPDEWIDEVRSHAAGTHQRPGP